MSQLILMSLTLCDSNLEDVNTDIKVQFSDKNAQNIQNKQNLQNMPEETDWS